MNELLEILKELHPDVDYENCTTLIDDKIQYDQAAENVKNV